MYKESNSNNICKQAVTFAHLSSESQCRGECLSEQVDILKKYCIENCFSIIKSYSFVLGTAKASRKHISEMLEFVEKQKHKTAIVVCSVNQLQRNFSYSEKIEELLEKDKIEIHFLKEELVLTKNSSASDIKRWDMYMSSANMLANIISQHIIQSKTYNLSQGKWQSKAPIGYVNVRDINNNASIEIDTIRAPIIKKLFEEYATGKHSIKSLTELAKSLGLLIKGKSVSNICIKHMLKNPFYYGEMCVKGQLIPHIYTPIIDKALFIRVQGKLISKNC